jgi:hypothetical protein
MRATLLFMGPSDPIAGGYFFFFFFLPPAG